MNNPNIFISLLFINPYLLFNHKELFNIYNIYQLIINLVYIFFKLIINPTWALSINPPHIKKKATE